MRELTPRQQEVLDFIRKCINAHYPPTVREIAEHFGMSVKGAYDHLAALKKKGSISMGRGSRTIEIIRDRGEEDPPDTVEIPILGVVAAGVPINVESNWDGTVPLHSSLLKNGRNYFALRVRGDSMIGAGIMDGDTAVIEQTETAQNGEIAVVQVNENTTLKRFYREASRIRLQSENDAYGPIYGDPENTRVLGRLIHILRSY
jgi:repressor LexA